MKQSTGKLQWKKEEGGARGFADLSSSKQDKKVREGADIEQRGWEATMNTSHTFFSCFIQKSGPG